MIRHACTIKKHPHSWKWDFASDENALMARHQNRKLEPDSNCIVGDQCCDKVSATVAMIMTSCLVNSVQ